MYERMYGCEKKSDSMSWAKSMWECQDSLRFLEKDPLMGEDCGKSSAIILAD